MMTGTRTRPKLLTVLQLVGAVAFLHELNAGRALEAAESSAPKGSEETARSTGDGVAGLPEAALHVSRPGKKVP